MSRAVHPVPAFSSAVSVEQFSTSGVTASFPGDLDEFLNKLPPLLDHSIDPFEDVNGEEAFALYRRLAPRARHHLIGSAADTVRFPPTHEHFVSTISPLPCESKTAFLQSGVLEITRNGKAGMSSANPGDDIGDSMADAGAREASVCDHLERLEVRLQQRLSSIDVKISKLLEQETQSVEKPSCEVVSGTSDRSHRDDMKQPDVDVEVGQARAFGSCLSHRLSTPMEHAHAKINFLTRRGKRVTAQAISKQLQSTLMKAKVLREDRCEPVRNIVKHPLFDRAIFVVLVANAGVVGIQVNNDVSGRASHVSLDYFDSFSACVFATELMLRVGAFEWSKFPRWTALSIAFDACLVCLSVFNFIVLRMGREVFGSGSTSILVFLKIARLSRSFRLIRALQRFAKVRVMVMMIGGSLPSLFWLCTLLLCLMYIFSIVLTTGAADVIVNDGKVFTSLICDHDKSFHCEPGIITDSVRRFFGSVPRTMFTLWQAMSGGMEWGQPAILAFYLGPVYFVVFCGFICFTTFSVLNIVTGVFVDGAIQLAEGDRETRMEREDDKRRMIADDLQELLFTLDVNMDGRISWEEWQSEIKRREVSALLSSLGITAVDAKELFSVMDVDGDGELSIVELVDGVQRAKGPAKGIHMQILLSRVNRISERLKMI
eukprot:TRINITY_DN1411_c0_g1_i1.p1 TRINITY_DN1411_c0_g1~~TRINITY_DN1411_c0_g1_i1.p1  ORF type:complete len:658 (-),score=106.78 TRINITY_DN1411_c0_g1_i1:128-2101(-)